MPDRKILTYAIEGISVKNFKSLRDSGKIKRKPITIFVGPNNSGKSSFIQLLLVLKQTYESGNIDSPLIVFGKYIDAGSYKDMVYHNDIQNLIEVSLDLKTAGPSDSSCNLNYKLGYDSTRELIILKELNYSLPKLGRIKIEDVKFKDTDEYYQRVLLLNESSGKIHQSNWQLKRSYVFYDFSEVFRTIEIRNQAIENLSKFEEFEKEWKKWLDETPEDKAEQREKYRKQLEEIVTSKKQTRGSIESLNKFLPTKEEFPLDQLVSIYKSLQETFTNIQTLLSTGLHYIGPLRNNPLRYYPLTGEFPANVGMRGEKTAAMLYYYFKKNRSNLDALQNIISKAGLGNQIEIKNLTENLYSIRIKDSAKNEAMNIADMGFGISQLLPILIQGITLEMGSWLIIEQPEIHLHPKLQAELSDYLIEVKNTGKFILIETHSEHMILRLQRRIAEGTLSHNDVAIYYFKKDEDGSVVSEVKINEKGTFETWPEGFFEEDLEDSMGILNALGKNKP